MGAALLCLSACSEKAPEASEPESGPGPNVEVSAQPDLAISFNYGFRLPVERIAATQEDHASQCEALGPTVCRVTGMTYHVGRDRRVDASLSLRLAPDAARRFGKLAIEVVGKHGGMLDDVRIESEEMGAALASANADTASQNNEREQVKAQLAKPGLPAAERSMLEQRLAFLADSSRQSNGVAQNAARALASTPMRLDYESGAVDLSLSDGPFVGAIKDGWSNILGSLSFMVFAAVTLVPWMALLALGWGGVVVVRRYLKQRPENNSPSE
ncbi:DUF4349 domain-containing protein [Novosphingobium nitrogenifigens]|uniref:DUF4349 domain-containing protein n=1 Tax=Novosphingobium nitrogenifigens TaxID=378548 RepID=UPI001E2C03A9|nr:DUF4349 domain-containing protein [Novosphingobium nitrogenifigens]